LASLLTPIYRYRHAASKSALKFNNWLSMDKRSVLGDEL